jgi:aryl-alcohol dehydrogenase-like predicted oxidoreductase
MTKRRLGRTDLYFEPLVFGGNVLGWTLDEAAAFIVLDAYADAGFTAIDTSDSYGKGASETILGNWMKSRGNRDNILVFTKVGSDMGQGHRDLSAKWIIEEVEASLRRLQVDYIDLYQSHWPDPNVGHEETLGAYARLVEAGKVRWIGSSNYTAQMHADADAISAAHSWPRYESEQPEYNLYARSSFEGPLQDYCIKHDIGVITYFSLAAGFLTGKYRSADDFGKSPRGARMERYLDDKGYRILAALDQVSADHRAKPAEVALAWVAAQPGVTAPIASATSVEQVESLANGARLTLSSRDLALLEEAGKD